jgi:hypothetical protein
MVMKPIRIVLLSFMLLFATTNSFAQDNLCYFNQTTAPYVPLGDEIDITNTVFLPDSYYVVTTPIGIYPLLGQQWDIDYNNRTISIFANGRVYLGLDTGFALFDCMYTDTMETLDATSKVSYWIEGTGNQQILKVQWKNLHIGPGPAGNYFNVQMWFYKETGVIEYHYGGRSANNASGYNTAGPVGIFVGMWHSNYNFTEMYEKIQVKGLPPNIQIDSNLNMNVPHIQGVPDSGTVYRFVPKAVASSVNELNAKHAISISPNPATDKVSIKLELTRSDETAITVIDATGRKVYERRKQRLEKGTHTFSISTTTLAAGQYYIEVVGKYGKQTNPVTIIK